MCNDLAHAAQLISNRALKFWLNVRTPFAIFYSLSSIQLNRSGCGKGQGEGNFSHSAPDADQPPEKVR
jgi:hypothetical protein